MELIHNEIKGITEDHAGNLHWSENLHFSCSCSALEEKVSVPLGTGTLQHCNIHWENKAAASTEHCTENALGFLLGLFYVCPSALSESKISYSGPAFS